MPLTIPPFSNVPAPGDPIRSPWAQQLTQYAVDNSTPNATWVTGVGPTSAVGKIEIEANLANVTTDATGNVFVGFFRVFSSPPVVVVSHYALGVAAWTVSVAAIPATTGFSLRVFVGAAPVATTALTISYIALGRRV